MDSAATNSRATTREDGAPWHQVTTDGSLLPQHGKLSEVCSCVSIRTSASGSGVLLAVRARSLATKQGPGDLVHAQRGDVAPASTAAGRGTHGEP